jgi:hypothetical protein
MMKLLREKVTIIILPPNTENLRQNGGGFFT